MSQAKVNRVRRRDEAINFSKQWLFEETDWESQQVKEILHLPVVEVQRAPPEQLAYARMALNKCHENVRWQVKNDPDRLSVAVSGWWLQWPNFVLHSVVARGGQLVCITPNALGEQSFAFIVDNQIEWREDGEVFSAYRNGGKIGPGLRAFPKVTIKQTSMYLERLTPNADPYKVMTFSDEEIVALEKMGIREYPDIQDLVNKIKRGLI